MIRKAIIMLLTLGALWTGIACSMSMDSARWLFSAGPVGMEIDRGTLVVMYGKVFLVAESVVWAYPQVLRASGQDGVLVVPLWIPIVLMSTYPVLAFIRGPVRRWRRRKKGLCIKCGYNLTGNVSGMCPECGEDI